MSPVSLSPSDDSVNQQWSVTDTGCEERGCRGFEGGTQILFCSLTYSGDFFNKICIIISICRKIESSHARHVQSFSHIVYWGIVI